MAGIKGMDKFLSDLERIEREFPSKSREFMNKIGNQIKADTKLNTPVDTGELRSKFFFKTTSSDTVLIYNNLHYAGHVEMGHRSRGGKGFVKGRYMLLKAIKKAERELPSKAEHFIKEVLKK